MARTIAKDHADKRRQIRSCAARLFAEQGFDGASMNSVAQSCGVSKANIYHYYDSKTALLFDLLDNHLRDLRDTVFQSANADNHPEDQLRDTISAVLSAYEGADNEHKIQLSAMSSLPKDLQNTLQEYQREMVAALSSILFALAPDVFYKNPSKLRATTMSVFGMLNWHYMWNAQATPSEREAYATLVSNLTLSGLNGI
ncbi:MAG: TetR/AcrR family transcriptional regulator [Paracoccaceae bacterium]